MNLFFFKALPNPLYELKNLAQPFIHKINLKRNIKNDTSITSVFRVVLQIKHKASEFQINFQFGQQEEQGKYIDLHFNPRWRLKNGKMHGFLVLNNRVNGSWGNETRSSKIFPFQPGLMSEILFEYKKDEWLIVIDNKHFFTYPHRLSINSIDHISIFGDVNIKLFEAADFQ